jgi:hypothetical protein
MERWKDRVRRGEEEGERRGIKPQRRGRREVNVVV